MAMYLLIELLVLSIQIRSKIICYFVTFNKLLVAVVHLLRGKIILKKSYANTTEKTTIINQDVQLSGHSTAVLIRENVVPQQNEPYIQKTEKGSKEQNTSKNQIPVLDGVRAVACLAVLSWHLNQITPALRGINNYLAALVYFGDSGVVLFFLLSGFLLFLPYAKALLFDSPWPSSYRFYLRRIFRILPGYFV